MAETAAKSDTAPTAQGPTDAAITAARAEIDVIDRKILALLADRVRCNEAIAAAKIAAGPGMPLRPTREVMMLRKLIAEAQPGVDADLVFDVWRAMIAANVRRQKPVEVMVPTAGDGGGRLFDIARRHFSGSARITKALEAREILNRVAENQSVVAVLPWLGPSGPHAWWAMLTERRYANIAIIAGLPMRGPGEPEAALVAAGATLEPAGEDITFGIAFDPHHRSTRALNESGLKGRELLRARETVIVELQEFVAPGDHRIAHAIREGLEGLRVIGSYARI
jgi:chorismate mutase